MSPMFDNNVIPLTQAGQLPFEVDRLPQTAVQSDSRLYCQTQSVTVNCPLPTSYVDFSHETRLPRRTLRSSMGPGSRLSAPPPGYLYLLRSTWYLPEIQGLYNTRNILKIATGGVVITP